MILQAVSILLKKSSTIVILPLNKIGEEQTEYIKQISRNPCFLNRDTFSNKYLESIQKGEYTHILISPELALGEGFRTALLNPQFKEWIGLVVLNKAYLVQHWGRDF